MTVEITQQQLEDCIRHLELYHTSIDKGKNARGIEKLVRKGVIKRCKEVQELIIELKEINA